MIFSQIIIKLPSEDKEKIRIAEEKIEKNLKDKPLRQIKKITSRKSSQKIKMTKM